jgi:glycosyltransferase involved in cell wall biosynthesis
MILETFAKKDVRIRLLRNDANSGLIASLNKAFQAAKGEYIARQDADDVSLPGRFESQVAFLDQHAEVGVVGTWLINIEEDGRRNARKTPISDGVIRWSLLFESSIVHASVMMRRSVFNEDMPYRPVMAHAEDYDLWARLSERTRLANLPACIYLRRRHRNRVSVQHHETQRKTSVAVMSRNIEKLLRSEVSKAIVEKLNDTYAGDVLETKGDFESVTTLIERLYRTYMASNVLTEDEQKGVARNAAGILTCLGFDHLGRWPAASLGVLWNAIRLSRSIPLNIYLAMLLKLFGEGKTGGSLG